MRRVRPVSVALVSLAGGWWLEGAAVGLGLSVVLVALFASAGSRRDPLGLLAGALALVPVVRAAGWIQALAVAGAVVTALLAAGGFATLGQAARTVARGVLLALPGPYLVIGRLLEPVRGRWGRALPAARGAVLATAVLAPFAALFASADAAFAQWVERIGEATPALGTELTVTLVLAAVFLALGGSLLRLAATPAPAPERAVPGPVGRTEWLIVLGALNALFAAFVAVQLATLFGGHDHVLETAGLTYAEYARDGFGQLLAAAGLTLALIAAARRLGVRTTARDERVQLGLLGGLCAMTLVVLASAHRRLGLYVEAFGQTNLRILAGAAILWIAAALVLLVVAHRAAWLPRGLVALGAAGLLAFAVSDPEARVASRNVERYFETGRLDETTLSALSEDAVPAVLRLPPPVRRAAMPAVARDGRLAAFNLARRRAAQALAARS